jgi:uncharacterized protein YggT (Ycf19 family)
MLLWGAARGRLGRRRADMITGIPIWAIVLDYVLGTIMWTLIGRSAMNVFLPVNSDFFFMKFFVRVTDPLLRLFRPVTPSFLVEPMVPLYVAWFFFIVRFYLMPWVLGYSVMGMLSFPLESDIARFLYQTSK